MEALAPWAEPVLVTADELLRLPDDERRYEVSGEEILPGFSYPVALLVRA